MGFIGITDVDVMRVEGVAVIAIGPQNALVAFGTARFAEIPARFGAYWHKTQRTPERTLDAYELTRSGLCRVSLTSQ